MIIMHHHKEVLVMCDNGEDRILVEAVASKIPELNKEFEGYSCVTVIQAMHGDLTAYKLGFMKRLKTE